MYSQSTSKALRTSLDCGQIGSLETPSVSPSVSEPSSSKTSHKIASSVISGSVLVRESSAETISLAVVPSGKNSGLCTATLSNCSWRSLKGSSASRKASDCFSFEIPAFSKQLTTVLVVTLASSIENSGSGFFFSIASITF